VSLDTYALEVFSALEVFLNDMRYINPRFTYLLTYEYIPNRTAINTAYLVQILETITTTTKPGEH